MTAVPTARDAGVTGQQPRGRRVVVIPGAPVLLAQYASLTDPVPALRAACREALDWLGDDVRVLADDAQGLRIAGELLGRTPSTSPDADVVVVANGSARRTEKAPGHLDDRAAAFDAHVGDMLDRGDLAGLAGLDHALATELLTAGLGLFTTLADEGWVVQGGGIDRAEDPFGVMYWVVRWQCAS
ncbi:hypothetical protein [Nocardioides yefusunii]|uniref:Uncharacterized protein n=1 Tax=Nocardioides yefusunii TaxID=2500546 RepID=A0ABW1QU86_9ACTN|nr:hypothetical protein [Nocardioides yefusunii]